MDDFSVHDQRAKRLACGHIEKVCVHGGNHGRVRLMLAKLGLDLRGLLGAGLQAPLGAVAVAVAGFELQPLLRQIQVENSDRILLHAGGIVDHQRFLLHTGRDSPRLPARDEKAGQMWGVVCPVDRERQQ